MQRSFPYAIRFVQFETRRREIRERLLLADGLRAARKKREDPARPAHRRGS